MKEKNEFEFKNNCFLLRTEYNGLIAIFNPVTEQIAIFSKDAELSGTFYKKEPDKLIYHIENLPHPVFERLMDKIHFGVFDSIINPHGYVGNMLRDRGIYYQSMLHNLTDYLSIVYNNITYGANASSRALIRK